MFYIITIAIPLDRDMKTPQIKMDEVHQIQKLVDERSFYVWKYQLNALLKKYGLADVVHDLEFEKPKKLGMEKRNEQKRDLQARKIILNTVHKKHVAILLTCDNARDMFQKLCFIFQVDGNRPIPRVFSLR